MIVVLLVLMALFASRLWNREKIPKGLGQQTLPDGTILVLRAALFDKDSEYAVESKGFRLDALIRRQYDEVLQKSQTPCVRFAFSRHDPESGDYLGFENISHVEFSDRWGSSIRTWMYSAFDQEWDGHVGSSETHTGDVKPPLPRSAGHRFLTLIAHRPAISENMSLTVMNWKGTPVAEFTIPAPRLSIDESHSVIATQYQESNVTAQLESVELYWDERNSLGSRPLRQGNIIPKISIKSDNKDVTDDWFTARWKFSDFLGNIAPESIGVGYLGEWALPDKLPRWTLETQLYRKHNAPFRDDEMVTLGSCLVSTEVEPMEPLVWQITGGWLVPPTTGTITIPSLAFGGGTKDRRAFVSGNTAEEPGFHYGGGGGWKSGGGTWTRNAERTTGTLSDFPKPFASIKCTWSKGQVNTTLSCKCDEHLLFLTTDIPATNRVSVIVSDQSGRRIRARPIGHMFRRMPIYSCKLFPDTTSLEIKAVFQTEISAEFEVPSPLADLDVSLSDFSGTLELQKGKWLLMPEPAPQNKVE